MATKKARRRWNRQNLSTPNLAIYYPVDGDQSAPTVLDNTRQQFIDITDQSPGGATALSSLAFDPGTRCILKIQNAADRSWSYFPAEAKWSAPSEANPQFHISGFEFSNQVPIHWPPRDGDGSKRHPTSEDFAFFY